MKPFHREKELKIKIPDKTAYDDLLQVFGTPDKILNQKNIYIDTCDFALRKCKLMFRLRFENDAWVATVKSKAKSIKGVLESNEYEKIMIGFEFAENNLLETLKSLYSEELPGDLVLKEIGSLTNTRFYYANFKGFPLEVDKTEYFDRIDYEIECECEQPEKAEPILKALFEQHKIAYEYQVPKYSRFLKVLEEDQ